MCGIVGFVSKNRQRVAAGLQESIQRLKHRGPEAQVGWMNPEQAVSLGHTRLCIIDLSEAAAQPFHYRDRYTIVYN
ncbi:MAG TPA: asparagine synthetase B, partial [Flavisolibacter sp.]|nr:asparagine synthetase B [Flavisolibacter sp.]